MKNQMLDWQQLKDTMLLLETDVAPAECMAGWPAPVFEMQQYKDK